MTQFIGSSKLNQKKISKSHFRLPINALERRIQLIQLRGAPNQYKREEYPYMQHLFRKLCVTCLCAASICVLASCRTTGPYSSKFLKIEEKQALEYLNQTYPEHTFSVHAISGYQPGQGGFPAYYFMDIDATDENNVCFDVWRRSAILALLSDEPLSDWGDNYQDKQEEMLKKISPEQDMSNEELKKIPPKQDVSDEELKKISPKQGVSDEEISNDIQTK